MKKQTLLIASLACLILSSCGDNKPAPAPAAPATEVVKEETYTGEPNTKEAVSFYIKKNYGIRFASIAPSFKYSEKGEIFNGTSTSIEAVFRVKEGENYSQERFKEAASKIYNGIKSVADSKLCICGFEEYDAAEKALTEKSLEEALKGAKIKGSQSTDPQWGFRKDGKFCRCIVSPITEEGNLLGYSVKIFDAIAKDVE